MVRSSLRAARNLAAFLSLTVGLIAAPRPMQAQTQAPQIVYTPAETAILNQLKGLRDVSDKKRGKVTADLALKIRALPAGLNKLRLADGLSHLSTEGDFGHATLQEVATTLATALTENPLPATKSGRPASPYFDLAKLARYEHVTTDMKDVQYTQTETLLLANEADIERADFTLTDLSGKFWSLSSLRGKVVLVNFWATWCPPCRKEMPDLDALAHRFAGQGLVVLSLSDEEAPKVSSYISSHRVNYPILLDPGGRVAKSFHVDGIPKSFIFDRTGKLVAQSIDMRTQGQFLQMLSTAGIQ